MLFVEGHRLARKREEMREEDRCEGNGKERERHTHKEKKYKYKGNNEFSSRQSEQIQNRYK